MALSIVKASGESSLETPEKLTFQTNNQKELTNEKNILEITFAFAFSVST